MKPPLALACSQAGGPANGGAGDKRPISLPPDSMMAIAVAMAVRLPALAALGEDPGMGRDARLAGLTVGTPAPDEKGRP